jgi:hypothetical protein
MLSFKRKLNGLVECFDKICRALFALLVLAFFVNMLTAARHHFLLVEEES